MISFFFSSFFKQFFVIMFCLHKLLRCFSIWFRQKSWKSDNWEHQENIDYSKVHNVMMYIWWTYIPPHNSSFNYYFRPKWHISSVNSLLCHLISKYITLSLFFYYSCKTICLIGTNFGSISVELEQVLDKVSERNIWTSLGPRMTLALIN